MTLEELQQQLREGVTIAELQTQFREELRSKGLYADTTKNRFVWSTLEWFDERLGQSPGPVVGDHVTVEDYYIYFRGTAGPGLAKFVEDRSSKRRLEVALRDLGVVPGAKTFEELLQSPLHELALLLRAQIASLTHDPDWRAIDGHHRIARAVVGSRLDLERMERTPDAHDPAMSCGQLRDEVDRCADRVYYVEYLADSDYRGTDPQGPIDLRRETAEWHADVRRKVRRQVTARMSAGPIASFASFAEYEAFADAGRVEFLGVSLRLDLGVSCHDGHREHVVLDALETISALAVLSRIGVDLVERNGAIGFVSRDDADQPAEPRVELTIPVAAMATFFGERGDLWETAYRAGVFAACSLIASVILEPVVER